MYLEHFGFATLPFILSPDTDFFCRLKGHREAIQTIQFSLQSGEGFVKVVGEVGSGKTLLCRKLLSVLDVQFVTAWIPNPDLTPAELRRAFARELHIEPSGLTDQHDLLETIHQTLLTLNAAGKKVVLLIDEAQAMSDESLEALRLLTNFETASEKLLQIVLFGQPELDVKLNRPHLRQLKQRIVFSCHLPVLSRRDVDVYLAHRLNVAGYQGLNLFTGRARRMLYLASRGVPRLVNILCHKALLLAWGRGDGCVNHKIMRVAVYDTEAVNLAYSKSTVFFIFLLVVLTEVILYWCVSRGIIL